MVRPIQYRDVTKEQLVNRIDDLATIIEAKDATIEILLDGILDMDEWISGRSSHICPLCQGIYGTHEENCLRLVAEAIRKVTS